MGISKLFLGILLGGAAVGGTAYFLSTNKGKKLVKDINLEKDKMLMKADEYLVRAKAKADEIIREAEANADSILNDANKILKLAKEKTAEVYTGAKENIEEEIHRLKAAIAASIEAYNNNLEKTHRTEMVVENIFNDTFLHPDEHERKKSNDRQFHKKKLAMDINHDEIDWN